MSKITTVIASIGESFVEFYYSLLSGRWRAITDPVKGYSIVMPVVPTFYSVTEWNLRFLFACDLTHCNEIVLVADSEAFREQHLLLCRSHAGSPLVKYLVLPKHKRVSMALKRTPYAVHATNLVTAINTAISEYLFFHDMDFFVTDRAYIEAAFDEIVRGRLNLVSAHTRHYPTGPTPAVFELMVRRDFVMGRPPFSLYGRNIKGRWFSTFEWLYRQVSTGKEHLRELDIGIHFKHLFVDFMEFEKGGDKVIDWYSLFILQALCASNHVAPRQIFSSVADCLDRIPKTAGGISAAVEAKYIRFCASCWVGDEERQILLESLAAAKKRI